MGFQVAFESEHVFAQSNVSRQRVPGGWSSNRKSATGQFGAYARNDQQREHQMRAEPEPGGACTRRDTLEWLWSAPCEYHRSFHETSKQIHTLNGCKIQLFETSDYRYLGGGRLGVELAKRCGIYKAN